MECEKLQELRASQQGKRRRDEKKQGKAGRKRVTSSILWKNEKQKDHILNGLKKEGLLVDNSVDGRFVWSSQCQHTKIAYFLTRMRAKKLFSRKDKWVLYERSFFDEDDNPIRNLRASFRSLNIDEKEKCKLPGYDVIDVIVDGAVNLK
jgi:hypothetical protein